MGRRFYIGLAHQALTHQEAADAMFGYGDEIRMTAQAALCNEGATFRRLADQFVGTSEVYAEVTQVTIVDADQP